MLRQEVRNIQDTSIQNLSHITFLVVVRHLFCKFPSVSTPGFAESTFVLRLVGVLLSFVCGRLCGGYRKPPKAFTVWAPVYRGDPLVCHKVQGDSVAKRQPSLCAVVGVLGVVTSCVPCARVPRVEGCVHKLVCN